MKQDDKVIDLLLPGCLEWNPDDLLIRALERRYSSVEIKEFLKTALQSIRFEPDKRPSYITSGSGSQEFYGGTGTIELFGRTIRLPFITPDGNKLTKEDVENEIATSRFYKTLSKL